MSRDPVDPARDAGKQRAEESATPTGTIARREKLSHRQFVREYLLPAQPVILTDAAGWPALKKWSPEYLRDRFGDREVDVQRVRHRLGEAIDRIRGSSATAPVQYLHNINIALDLPELLDDLDQLACYSPNWLRRWWFPSRRAQSFRSSTTTTPMSTPS
jgi:hypothetical protein